MEKSIFNQYIEKRNQIVKNKKVLQTTYIPEQLPHRSRQIEKIASIIAIALQGEKPSNIMAYGKTGTGKTATLNFIGKELKKADPDEKNCSYVYVNCEVVDTAYGILYSIGNQISLEGKIPFTGWSIEKTYSVLVEQIDRLNKVLIVVLDEIDKMVYKKGDDIFYYLAKINENLIQSKVSLIGISNDMKFLELLEPKARSRLGGESLMFPPYTKDELEDIITERIQEAFEDGMVDESVIHYCAAAAAKVDGDARVALDLLRVATDIAERNGDMIVTDAHVKSAKNTIEFDVVSEAVRTLPLQSKLVLLSILKNTENTTTYMTTGTVFTTYTQYTKKIGVSTLTQRRITDIISELDMMGLINASVLSFGRGGRTKKIQLNVSSDIIDILVEDSDIRALENTLPSKQTKLM